MSRDVRLRQARQQPLLKSGGSFVGEVIGGTTAECAVVCCCVPCAVANLLALAIYKVPAGLCRRALRKRQKQMTPPRRRRCSCGCDDMENQIHPDCILDVSSLKTSPELDKELQQLEEEMWERFYGTGFWRSQSQRESSDPNASTKPKIQISPKWEISKVTYVSSTSTVTNIL